MPILKFIGILMIIGVSAFAGYIFVNASKLQEEIEAEVRDREEK